MKSGDINPTEDVEQSVFVQWLTYKKLKYTAIPNSTYTTSWKQKNHNKMLGLHAGFPDLIVLIPPQAALDGQGRLLAIEMKRIKGGRVSEAQTTWIDAINELDTVNIRAKVCNGADEAIDYVSVFLKN